MSREVPEHHILWPRRTWNSWTETKELRHRKGLIVPIDIDLHQALHREVSIVPLPSFQVVSKINQEFYPAKKDPLQTIQNLMEAVNDATAGVDPVNRQLGRIMMLALEMQIPFLEKSEATLHGTTK